MSHNAIETVLGGVVVIVAGMFVSFAYETAQVKVVKGNELCASFLKIGGLDKGSDVRVNGIKVGTVTSLHLDTESYEAVTCMNIQPDIKLPVDSEAAIGSEGVLGGKYIRLTPGVKKAFIPAGGKITKTTDFRSLEDQVGEIIFLATGGDEKKEGGSGGGL
ncbi:MAG: MCE family protein [Rhodospirillaceae bacterium]|jgi:phospholipid/cholesterol/gamma-HCH transport system substrate-binding protein|nr:MCE family protein [Rhodospirillales bacterium]MBT3904623.1 MCE family protein [Rhodospirillaceae bacterium]MBT4700678.1 MCE family protein [Rhodospirillaceae bacterium]MBT5032884.1 MCE family protein [Rhodospirillaceae bacterium]MBT6221431.1 MCE family protein [Rhodospirillaceae bacterium]